MGLPIPFRRSREAVCYEVSLAISAHRAEEFDAWLLGHVREMLAFPGFQDATVYRHPERDADGRERRVVSYEVRSRRELESYLHVHAKRMRDEGRQKFGKDLAASREIVALSEYEPDPELLVLLDEKEISGGLPICGNCHNPVEGRFCKVCGQEDRTYLLSLRELVGEFLGELTNFDSRFFRSIKPLLFKPGLLTVEYIRGRRQHYFPPIRLYIIVSILFFFVAAVMTDSGLSDSDINLGVAEETTEEERQEAIERLEERIEESSGPEREALLVALGSLRAGDDIGEATERAVNAVKPEQPMDSPTPGDQPGTPESDPANAKADVKEMEWLWSLPSLRSENGVVTASGWGSEKMNERMVRGVEAIKENPKAFVRNLIDNIPSMMLIFLPLIALALKILYLFSSRYYVEHLMFSLHVHSAVFVILLVWMLLGELADVFTPLDRVMGWITAAVWIYIPVYLYKAMRRVYGQGHFFTSFKFFLLSNFYIVAAGITSVFLFIAAVYQQA